MRCLECDAETAQVAQFCVRCGTLAAGGAGDSDANGTDRGAGSRASRARRWYFLMFLACCLLLPISAFVGTKVSPKSDLAGWVGGAFIASLCGAVGFLAAFVRTLSSRARGRQAAWTLVPIVSFSFLAWWPFLVLALIRRRARDWAVFAAYLVAVATEIALVSVGGQVSATTENIGIAMIPVIAVTAAVHALVAFRPAAEVQPLFKPERVSGLASGHTVDRAGTTHIFRTYRGIRMIGVIALAAMIVTVCAGIIAHGPQGGFNVWAKIVFIVIFVLPSAWFAVRWFRLAVKISSGKMTVRNLWRTRVIAIDEIHRIDLATKRGDHASPTHWVPRIDLTNGDSIWIEGFSCGIAHGPPDPEGVAALGEFRSLIGLQPPKLK